MNLNVEDMLTLFLGLLGILFASTYLKYNTKYLFGPERTDNLFLRAVILLVFSVLLVLCVNSFGRVLEVLGYSDPTYLLSKIRRALYIVALIFMGFSLIMLSIVTKPSK